MVKKFSYTVSVTFASMFSHPYGPIPDMMFTVYAHGEDDAKQRIREMVKERYPLVAKEALEFTESD
jgi:hypothetical protein